MKIIVIIHILFALALYKGTTTFIFTQTANAIRELHAVKVKNSYKYVLINNFHLFPLYLIPIINIYVYATILKEGKKQIYKKVLEISLNF